MASLPHEVTILFIVEEKIIKVVERWWDQGKLTTSSDQVDAYITSWRSKYQELKPSSEEKYHVSYDVLVKLVGNPVHVFSLMDRLVNLLPQIMDGMGEGSDLRELRDILDGLSRFPDSSDLIEASLALVRVQFVYQLDPLDLSNGLIGGVQTAARLREGAGKKI